MDPGVAAWIETALRIALGLRFLSSGVSNIRRWPHATETARVLFPVGSYFFGAAAVALMVLGGAGLLLGLQTRISALLVILFLLPMFPVQRIWIRTLPEKVTRVKGVLRDEALTRDLLFVGRHAIHGHESTWKDNAILLLAALLFLVRGSVAFGLDNWLR